MSRLLKSPVWILAVLTTATSCAPAIQNFAYTTPERHAPKAEGAFIELFEAPHPDSLDLDREFEVIARFQVKQQAYVRSGLIESARERAREVGGDAIVISTDTGFEGSALFDLDTMTVWVLRYGVSDQSQRGSSDASGG